MSFDILERMERAVANVRERLLRATAALNQAGVPYAVVGGNAVASWVATVDEGAVRNTPDIDLLVQRDDLQRITVAMMQAGFVADPGSERKQFLDGEAGKPREAVRLYCVGEPAAPVLTTMLDPAGSRVLALVPLVEMKLSLHRLKDRVHIRDLIDVGLVDASWLPKLPPELAKRLQHLLDTPDG